VLRIAQMIQKSMEDILSQVDYRVVDTSEPNFDARVMASSINSEVAQNYTAVQATISTTQFVYSQSLPVADRIYTVFVTAKNEFITANSQPAKIISITCSLVGAAVLCIFVIFIYLKWQTQVKMNKLLKAKVNILETIIPPRLVDRVTRGEIVAEYERNVSILFMCT